VTTADAATEAGELAHEQAYVTMLYDRLDGLRNEAVQRLSTVRLEPTAENDQAWSERDSFAQHYEDRVAQFDAAERNLCFGRLDFDEDDRLYIGRLGLRSDDYDQLLVDWRAPAAAPFYRATAVQRHGVTRRRYLHTVGRRVVRVDDDVLDLDAVHPTHLVGEAALLASLRRGRTGRMHDIVATIQADQDRIIREALDGVLVVDGGPGTGKTVVALHRAAYLLYAHRDLLRRHGILIVGPNRTFLRYIDQVLPSLGETDVVLATVAQLYPGVLADADDPPRAARIKGDARMAGVLQRAVRELPQIPSTTVEIKIHGVPFRLTPDICRRAATVARRRRDPATGAPLPHNQARSAFVNAVLDQLARQNVRSPGTEIPRGGTVQEIRADLAAEPAVHRVLDALWPLMTPPQLLALLYQQPERLDLAAEERAALGREQPHGWTPADVALLDELAELLGEADDDAARRRRAEEKAGRAEAIEYAAQLVEKLAADGAIALPPLEFDTFVTWVANRNAEDVPRGSLAERALQDRTWTYRHIIVDEAQELSAMAWRMLSRRCPTRSMTVVGDLAQTSAAGGAESWAQVLDPIAAGQWRTARLTVNYRTPKQAMSLAAELLPVAVAPPVSVRDGDEPWTADERSLTDLLSHEVEAIGAGRIAVIAPPARIAETAAALDLSAGPDIDAPVAVLTAQQAKGLEFDSVIVVDPTGIEKASPRGPADLYVAMTRTTRRLGLLHRPRQ
jgi:DNA helicase IV